jgi:hypothetical protein
MDLFNSYNLQREDILSRIAQGLQLDNTRRERMESAYQALSKIIQEDDGFFKGMEIDIYAQGSVPIGTTVKPWQGDEFDLDIVLHIKKPYHHFTPQEIYNALLKKLEEDGRYSHMVEKKRRCLRLKYAGDFHMDILPGCIIILTDEHNLKVPDRELRDWADTNPKGYAEWFLNIANSVQQGILEGHYRNLFSLKAQVEDLPKDDFYKKKPLQTSVQLIKRYRDIYFQNDADNATSSVILTTIAGLFYKGERSIFDSIDNILSGIQSESGRLRLQSSRIKIMNPVNANEDFSEKWDTEPALYQNFILFTKDFYEKWQILKKEFSLSASTYEKLFGENMYKGAIKQQLEKMGSYSSDPLYRAGSLIISGTAKTDYKGNINQYEGSRNERHRDFGDKKEY